MATHDPGETAMRRSHLTTLAACLALTTPALMGADGGADGCGRNEPMPNVSGAWQVDYADTLDVEITLGGTVYRETLGAQGGSVTISHAGQPFTFDLDCARAEVLCPSEVWPETVTMAQPDPHFEARVTLTLPSQTCDGALVAADPAKCGAGTRNPDCDDVCEGTVITTSSKREGLLHHGGDAFSVLLGAGAASNGVNCLLLGLSVAEADVVSTGGPRTFVWEAVRMDNGKVTTGYAGGCLWAGPATEALALGATVKVSTPFTANRL
jgi:hypothetical protein